MSAGSPGDPAGGASAGGAGGVGPNVVKQQVSQLREWVAALDQVVADVVHGDGVPAGAPAGGGPFTPCYPSLQAWVDGYFTALFARPTSPTLRWCAHWWAHPEAISRLEACWRSWEVARLDPLRGMAGWYRDVADPQAAVLLSASGPFASCTTDRHAAIRGLPTVAAPDGYWDDDGGEPVWRPGPPPGGGSSEEGAGG